MSHPLTWVVTLPSNDVNGEDGTIQAGEYAKGDTATLFVYTEGGHVDVSDMHLVLDNIRRSIAVSSPIGFVVEHCICRKTFI